MSEPDEARDSGAPVTGDASRQELGVRALADEPRTGEFGSALREAREEAGLSVADVANTLKVTEFTVEALENERYEELPPRPYIRGYVKRYARLVGLDAGPLTVGFDTVEAEPVVRAVVPRSPWASFSDFARQSWGVVYGSIVLVFVILIGGALWWAWPGGNAEQAVPETDAVVDPGVADLVPDVADDPLPAVGAPALVSTPRVEADPAFDSTPASPATPEPVAALPLPPGPSDTEVADSDLAAETASGDGGLAQSDVIKFVFEAECWVEVRDRDDDLVHGDLGRGGETVAVRGRAPFSILVGNAAVVDISFNGEPVAMDSTVPGEVARLVVGD
ncbi:MAG: helix-turn-helix domain-containing protein [Gammaproteobacteria bacterium]|nr:helix-turn-helix domain-containing protein [Gammaproteobacteria bacterium]MYF28977.1 helix-turn-helix domain-containing protein [Gammaproteobacteria bacterium]MYK45941.1 helix-turn-helix domain-containing protein [Gammaproteobacteria bacterium]